ncbi:zinc ribbon domain-containing protein [Paludicola sp. MB14-C6]|uniref:effector binding domain-containing protein n=1 Tax=Paludihabitans sp. MB14-C6 TaxID=3070656 RepID=UPI0027DC3E44|nr:effector binding domain-containing protein [Paludicola sp. MB14-C6]WMJ21939.1 zinc ribbon domain-containing protein [Paludicola sp. MB14-C6]
MNYEIVNLKEKTIIGVKATTQNNDPSMPQIIGGLWQKFYQDGIYASILNKASEKAYGIYSDYQANVNGPYQVTVGCEVTNVNSIPANTTIQVIPAGIYAKFIVKGHMQQAVASFWQQVWNIPLDRSYLCDFEEYQDDCMENAEINIYISLASANEIAPSFCQSCGMPMSKQFYSTNADGSENREYCSYCYQNGAFLKEESMEEMIESCIPFMIEDNPAMTAEQARAILNEQMPQLKRWNK